MKGLGRRVSSKMADIRTVCTLYSKGLEGPALLNMKAMMLLKNKYNVSVLCSNSMIAEDLTFLFIKVDINEPRLPPEVVYMLKSVR